MTQKKKQTKKEVYFIATRIKNRPIKVSFYTKKDGKEVESSMVKKEHTNHGVRLFAGV